MGNYRYSRNIEASLIDFLDTKLDDNDWANVRVVKTFKLVSDGDIPAVCLRVSDSTHNKVEIGNNNTYREVLVLVDIFATNDGQRLDIKDCLVDELRDGCPYYQYVIANGSIDSKTVAGRINITEIDDTPVDFGVSKSDLDPRDRYRHLLTLHISLGKVES